jgi:hypothetical protein
MKSLNLNKSSLQILKKFQMMLKILLRIHTENIESITSQPEHENSSTEVNESSTKESSVVKENGVLLASRPAKQDNESSAQESFVKNENDNSQPKQIVLSNSEQQTEISNEAKDSVLNNQPEQIIAPKHHQENLENWVKPELPVYLKNEQPISFEEASVIIGDSITLKIWSKNFRERIDGFTSLKNLFNQWIILPTYVVTVQNDRS